jgi:hypothetical protein
MSIMSVSATVQPGPRDAIDTLMQFGWPFQPWRQASFLIFEIYFSDPFPKG